MSTTAVQFDLRRFTQAAERRDAATQLAMYAPDATVTIVDRITQPRAPRVLHGHEEIGAYLADLYGREMTHTASHHVAGGDGAAFLLQCRYPDGTTVFSSTLIALTDGVIAEQSSVQAWDEA